MAKDSSGRQQHLRQLIAQQAARMMAEEGITDFSHAKRKAGKQLGATDINCLPTNSEIEEEIRLYHEIYNSEDQPENLRQLRADAVIVMRLLERFNPHLTGPVLDGTAGKFAETHIHLFADSLKDVEMFLLNQQIPYETNEKSYRVSERRSSDRKGGDRKKVPVFTLEGPHGLIRLSVFEIDDLRTPTRSPANGQASTRVNLDGLKALIALSRLNPELEM
ncbi:hypothetical protein [Methylovorus glucosotrophus]|jgi:hypothetical protein|uniref:Uncharacterized protein n=1 Tax=Methylovorus glucosotrophus (strain SIP3-4) TaxID=582744 RepID=C6XAX5_METGS|nr:hypothetical protein [Methylovorus glucosotrophus]ACT51745.1 conserved hypothetical protein [Methylovorus glucosotrophus SIP3-4]KAF0842993.1 hypothetical protein FNL37_0406 [Methylovorus glucosotrophus]